MNEEKLLISVNEEDVQNIINCYEKDLKELNQLQNNWNELDKWLIEKLKEYQKSKYPGEYGLVLGFIWEMQRKMQELEDNNE